MRELLSIAEPYTSGDQFDPSLDEGIERAVLVLHNAGVTTFSSCEGGEGHCFPEPTVKFQGSFACAMQAAGIAINSGLPVKAVRETWSVQNGRFVGGPCWEMTFDKKTLVDPDWDLGLQIGIEALIGTDAGNVNAGEVLE